MKISVLEDTHAGDHPVETDVMTERETATEKEATKEETSQATEDNTTCPATQPPQTHVQKQPPEELEKTRKTRQNPF